MKSRIKNEVTNDKTDRDVQGLFLASRGPVWLAGKIAYRADADLLYNAVFFTTHGSSETEKKRTEQKKRELSTRHQQSQEH